MAQIERIPPHSAEAERSVLGSILIDKEIYFKVSEFLNAEDFYEKANQEIYAAMNSLYQGSCPIDVITVSEELMRRKSLEACGGRSYLAELSSEVPTTANAVQYARIVAEKSIFRKLITAGSNIVEDAFLGNRESTVVLDSAENQIFNIAKNRQTRDYIKIQDVLAKNLDAIKEAEKRGGKIPGVATGYTELDKKTQGLQKSDLIIVAARPSMGKTALALNIADNVAIRNGQRVAMFSAEMSDESLGLRFLSMRARVESSKLRNGTLSQEEWESVQRAIEEYQNADLLIDATPNISVMEIRNKCRRMNSERKLDLVIVDYLQILETGSGKAESRVLEVGQMTKQLKQMARELECPVVVLSQLSRGAEKREGDKRPMMSDLRDSGSIEQDADVIMFIHREDYYKKELKAASNEAEIIIAKQRQGETTTVKLTWIPRFTRFVNMEYNDAVPKAES